MENQLAQPEILIRRIAIVAVALVLVMSAIVVSFHVMRVSDPYFQSILSLNGDSARGHAIFEINCAGCHGVEAAGLVGPSLQHVSQRKSKIGLIEQVTSGETPPMPKFQPHPQEMADLLSYLQQL